MLNFKKSSAIFLLLLLSVNICKFTIGISYWWYLLPVVFLLSAAAYGSFHIQSSFYFDIINRIKSSTEIIITFDDGPHPVITPKVLSILKKHSVKATFFCVGKNVDRYPQIVKQIHDEGHDIGNHTYSHHHLFGFFSAKKVAAEIYQCNQAIENISGKTVSLFRPPVGITNPNVKRALKKIPLKTIGWSLRTLDTVTKDHNKILKKLHKVRGGDIILFHDRIENIDQLLDHFLDFCKQQNIKIIPVSKIENTL